MSFSYCYFSYSPLRLKIDHFGQSIKPCGTVVRSRVNSSRDWSFIGGSRFVVKPKVTRLVHHAKSERIHASWFSGSHLASSVFTFGTVAVLPFYTLMVLAPKSELTKKSMESSIPYAVLGVLYAYLLYLSWTPETVRLIFASKYWLPQLTSIAKMFSNEFTLASAWIHLLVVDLFAARHVFQDGLENQIETRHSVSFCLFFCPIGILTHVITKAMTKATRKEVHHSV
ncbi:hypothetical protein RIF29_13958 [Crotalaria pallida]|uniref:Protein ABA DEFICIENT 4, chloroplastic-like n=1 Tax=Crotalaria pallida TaxID=3830 RepID=A0AAN9FCX0_CROPI